MSNQPITKQPQSLGRHPAEDKLELVDYQEQPDDVYRSHLVKELQALEQLEWIHVQQQMEMDLRGLGNITIFNYPHTFCFLKLYLYI